MDAVHDESGHAWRPHVPDGVTPQEAATNALYHVRVVESTKLTKKVPCEDQEQVMLLGIVTGYKTPDNGTVNGMSASSRNPIAVGNKRIKAGIHQLSSKCKIMQLADCMEGQSLVFALVFAGPNSLFAAAGSIHAAYDIKMGDVIGVYEPRITLRYLGSSIPIYDSWTRIVVFKQNLNIPPRPIVMSSQANQQINFVQSGVTVRLSKIHAKAGAEVKCYGKTCDRQDIGCTGCQTGSVWRRNFTLETMVEILDQPQYDPSTGSATFYFRSYVLTELLIDLSTLANDDYETLKTHDNGIRLAARALCNHVNDNGGWTVYGWHRRGIVTALEDGTHELSANTEGHLVRVEPTRQTEAFLADLRGRRYSAP